MKFHVAKPLEGSRPYGRLYDLDRAKGFAIFLVVLGHIITADVPEGNAWFVSLVEIIYSFHMPFFMYLSGFVMLYTFGGLSSLRGYGDYVSKRFWRLAPGFVVFAVVILFGKILASQVIHVDNQPDGIFSGLIKILFFPGESSAKSLWFIYVLLQLYILFPLLLLATRGSLIAAAAIGLAVHFAPSIPFLMIDGLFEYAFYFSIGCLVAKHYERYTTLIDRYWLPLQFAFLLSLTLLYSSVAYPHAKLIIGTISIPALHALIRNSPLSKSSTLLFWGSLSYPIYLMNTIAIGVAKGIVLYFTTWDGVNFLWVAPLLLCAGLFGPIVVKRYFLPWVPPIDRITN